MAEDYHIWLGEGKRNHIVLYNIHDDPSENVNLAEHMPQKVTYQYNNPAKNWTGVHTLSELKDAWFVKLQTYNECTLSPVCTKICKTP